MTSEKCEKNMSCSPPKREKIEQSSNVMVFVLPGPLGELDGGAGPLAADTPRALLQCPGKADLP